MASEHVISGQEPTIDQIKKNLTESKFNTRYPIVPKKNVVNANGSQGTDTPTPGTDFDPADITPSIGSNGNWFIGDTDTGTKAQGPKGDPGPAGANGTDGVKGDKGDPGDPGATGPAGPAGADGAKGDPGIAGPKGDPGNRGAGVFVATVKVTADSDVNKVDVTLGSDLAVNDYIIDTDGDMYQVKAVADATVTVGVTLANMKGPKGDKGDPGATGATGLTGPKGDPGATGAAGTNGVSPTITVKTNTADTYILTITTADGSFDTPNLYKTAPTT